MLISNLLFIKKFLKWIQEAQIFEVSNSPYQLLDHYNHKNGFYQKIPLLNPYDNFKC